MVDSLPPAWPASGRSPGLGPSGWACGCGVGSCRSASASWRSPTAGFGCALRSLATGNRGRFGAGVVGKAVTDWPRVRRCPNPQMQPTSRAGPALRAGSACRKRDGRVGADHGWNSRHPEEQRNEGSSVGSRSHPTRPVQEVPRRFTRRMTLSSLHPTAYGFLPARVDFDRSRSTCK